MVETMKNLKNYSFDNEVPSDQFLDYIPTYIKNRWADYDELADLIGQSDFIKISRVCHRILGSAQMYGLNFLDNLVKELQITAKSHNRNETKFYIGAFKQYLISADDKLNC